MLNYRSLAIRPPWQFRLSYNRLAPPQLTELPKNVVSGVSQFPLSSMHEVAVWPLSSAV